MMAGSLSGERTRLSVRAATEPLPTPLPPPPRLHTPSEPVTELTQLHPPHSAPPRPHLTERRRDCTDSHPHTAHEPGLDRSLRSPGVLISLSLSTLLLVGIGWYQVSQRSEPPRRPSASSVVLERVSESWIDDCDLPYITDVPLVPARDATSVVERDSTPEPKKTQRVTLNNSTLNESPGAPGVTETQRR